MDNVLVLTIESGGAPSLRGCVFELDPAKTPTAIVGRAKTATVVLESDTVSRRHARLTWTGEAWIIRDEASTHGLYVNTQKVSEATLAAGDVLWLADVNIDVSFRAPRSARTLVLQFDPQTGLANRRFVAASIADALRDERRRAAVILDVDGTRALSERLGFAAIDSVLVEVAKRVSAAAPRGAIVGRLRGDRFVVLLDADLAAARALAETLRRRVTARMFTVGERSAQLRLSVGVACEGDSADSVLAAAEDDLHARRPQAFATTSAIDWALSVWTPQTSRTVDVGVGASATGDTFVVSDGAGGHSTGWLGARFVVRTLLERFGAIGAVFGAADVVPDEWGWAGAMASRETGERVYAILMEALGDPAKIPGDLVAAFEALDRVLVDTRAQTRVQSALVGCIAARVEGRRVTGAHVGAGIAQVLRVGAARFEELVVPHYLDRVADRFVGAKKIDLDALPSHAKILCNGLGALAYAGIGVDRFEATLAPGDLLLLASSELAIDEGVLAQLCRTSAALTEATRSIERALDEARWGTSERAHISEVAIALLRCRDAG